MLWPLARSEDGVRCCEKELSALCGTDYVLELAGEESFVSMSHVLKIELNLVLDSSWSLYSIPPCIISGTELQSLSETGSEQGCTCSCRCAFFTQ